MKGEKTIVEMTDYIDSLITNGQLCKPMFNMKSPVDILVIKRMAYFKYGIPLITEREAELTEDEHVNCFIDMYNELKSEGKIYNND